MHLDRKGQFKVALKFDIGTLHVIRYHAKSADLQHRYT